MLVSVVIPTYNRAKRVVIAIESALGQTYRDIEVLVVDDGSKDDTAAVLAARYGSDPRVKYLPKPNGGVSSARNWGIERAKGEAIAFLDSDDEWSPTKLERQVAIFEARPQVGLVLTGLVELDDDRKPTGRSTTRRESFPRDGSILADVVRDPRLVPSCALVRTGLARAIGGFDTTLRTAEDLDFHLRLARLCDIVIIEDKLTQFRRGEGGLANELCTYHDHVFVVERFLDSYPHELTREDARDARLSAYLSNARGLAYYGDLKTAAQLGMKSLPLLRHARDVQALAKISAMVARGVVRRVVKRVRGAGPSDP